MTSNAPIYRKKDEMKNKSKLKKIREKNVQEPSRIPAQWLYLSPQEITVQDVRRTLDPDNTLSLEVWTEAGVLEITLPDGKTIDLEAAQPDLPDPYGHDFVKQHHTRSLFYVTVHPASFPLAEPVMKQIADANGGFFCGDTEDFTPSVP